MRNISGHYTKHGKVVLYDVDIPSSWEELKPPQAAFILEVLTYRRANKFMMGVALLAGLFGKHWDILDNLPDDELNCLVPLTNFILETRPAVKNLFPKLNLRKKECLAPADDLSNIGFGEWCFAYEIYHGYCATHQKSYLHKLIAVLYRPEDPAQNEDNPNYNGDQRQVFNENLIATRERAAADIEEKLKQAVLSWYAGALLNVMTARPNLFPVNDGAQEDEPDPLGDNRTWFTVFRELLGPKWGTIEDLKHTNALFVLDALEEQSIEHKATKK